jgi:ATP-dependent Lhr-like helicase
VVLERFFDESGGMQLVVHAPFGSRINKAWGLALRKRFCVGFGFELQAAANEEAIVLSLGPQHAFELEEVFDYLHPDTAREVLTQAILTSPMFETRWRWNVQRSLLLDRSRNGKKVPAALLRMRADDLLVTAFPQVVACNETLPPGPIEVPMEHPIVRQTIEDCLTEAMDVDGLIGVLRELKAGRIERVAIDTAEPSAFARGILNSAPYTFLDDAPLEERRTQAVMQRRVLDVRTADELGALDPEAIARVKEEAWPQPESAEEVHEALLWMGYVTAEEARPWTPWVDELEAARRIVREGERIFAVEASRDPKTVLRGRLEAIGPVESDDPLLREIEAEGAVLRVRIGGRDAWCDRRLLARIHRYTVERLRREIEPVTAADFLRFLACWQHVDPEHRLHGPRGVAEVVAQLAGFEIPAALWEGSVLGTRVHGYKREWLDQLSLSGEVAWARLWGAGTSVVRRTPVSLVLREELDTWLSLAPSETAPEPKGAAAEILTALRGRGAMFFQELTKATRLLPSMLEPGLGELVAQGRVTSDSFAGLRWLMVPAAKRQKSALASGRWSLVDRPGGPPSAEATMRVARQMLRRTGVVFRNTLARERHGVAWRDLARVYRTLEARGEIRGGRFVAGFSGEQFALPAAVELLRSVRKRTTPKVRVAAGDPLNFVGILTPDEKVSPGTRQQVLVG